MTQEEIKLLLRDLCSRLPNETFVFDESSRQYVKIEEDIYTRNVNVKDDNHFKSNEIDMKKLMETFEKIGINKLK